MRREGDRGELFTYSQLRLILESARRPDLPPRAQEAGRRPYEIEQFTIAGAPAESPPCPPLPRLPNTSLCVRGVATSAGGYPSMVRAWLRLLRSCRAPVTWNEPLRPPDEDCPLWSRFTAGRDSFGMCSAISEIETGEPNRSEIIVNACPPNSWLGFPGSINVGYTMIETDRLPRGWAEKCNLMDVLWVPCQANVEAFERQVQRPVFLAPIPVDTLAYHPQARPMVYRQSDVTFRFLAIADWSRRKNLWATIEAFGMAFSGREDVELVLRTWSDGDDYLNPVIDAARRYRVRIHLLDRPIPEQVMPNFFRAHQALVVSSCGEGFGLVPYEAMACGLPTILPEIRAFRGVTGAVTVATTEAHGDPQNLLYQDGVWEEVCLEQLAATMAMMEGRREGLEAVGREGREFVVSHFSAEVVARRVAELIELAKEAVQ